ncbi:MAG: Stp1/IreP family PP2C-type Ser/Thr phosphatase [Eubacteriales bacterium]
MIDIGKTTHLGKIRQINEDSFLIEERETFVLLVVADGMGGHNAGEVASMMAIQCMAEYIEKNGVDDADDALRSAICYANKEIHFKASNVQKNRGMGTTVTAALIKGNDVVVANVGDSRTYLYRQGLLNQITKDHSYVQQLVDKKLISAEEEKSHPQRNLITRAVGTAKRVIVDTFKLTLESEDVLMLCSDGLTSHVTDEKIASILTSRSDASALTYLLQTEALKRGGSDNITIIVAKTGKEE